MGDLRVLATARRTRVRLRVAVQRKSPHLKSFRSASGSNLRRTCHAVGVRRVAEGVFTAHDTKLTFLVCITVITIILSLLIPVVTFHIAADVAATVLSF